MDQCVATACARFPEKLRTLLAQFRLRRVFGCLLTSALLLVAGGFTSYADEINSYAGLTVFSAITFSSSTGDYSGLQITITPYGAEGDTKILWRSAEGQLNEPMLLDASKAGGSYKVTVPEGYAFSGEWTFIPKGTALHAVGPNGLAFNLVKLPKQRR